MTPHYYYLDEERRYVMLRLTPEGAALVEAIGVANVVAILRRHGHDPLSASPTAIAKDIGA